MKNNNSVSSLIKNTAAYVLVLGVLFISVGLAIVFRPEIVTVLVVSAFVFLGVVSIMFGLQILNAYNKVAKLIKKLKID